MHENESEVLARIEATRARMGETIDLIGDRVNPDRVQAALKARAREQVREVKANVKHKARSVMRDIEHGVNDAGRGVWDTIRDNPIPAGMVGVGIAWLVANGVRHHDDDPSASGGYAADARDQGRAVAATGEHGENGGEERGMAAEARERVSEAADSVKERASHVRDEAREKAQDVAHEMKEKASDLAHWAGTAASQAGRRARRAEHRVEQAVHDNPLAAGAIVAALGFATGMMVPESDREHEMFGPTRDRLMENAGRRVRSAGEEAKEAVKETASEGAKRVVSELRGSSDSGSGTDSGTDSGTGFGGRERETAAIDEPGR